MPLKWVGLASAIGIVALVAVTLLVDWALPWLR